MLHQALRGMSLHDPVLVEVAPAPEHIQHPVEAIEEWVGIEGGLFEACEREEDAYLIYTLGSGGERAQQLAVAKKTIRKKKAKTLLRPVTRSQARPRVRTPTVRLAF